MEIKIQRIHGKKRIFFSSLLSLFNCKVKNSETVAYKEQTHKRSKERNSTPALFDL